MKKYKRIICAVIASILLLGAVPAYAASSNNGLNGSSCLDADFDESVYDVSLRYIDVYTGTASWPSSGTVLVTGCPTNATTFNKDLKKITVPDGLIVDFYTDEYKPAGVTEWTRTCMAHFDTTGSSTSGNTGNSNGSTGNSTGNSGNSNNSTGSGPYSEQWGTVKRVYTPGTPSASYSNYYTDVPETMWCYHPVMTLTEGGLLAGYGNNKFGPNDTLTKKQVRIIFARLIGNEPDGNGEDTPASRAYAAIWYAGRLSSRGGTKLLTDYESSIVGNAGGICYRDDGYTIWGFVYDNWRASIDAGRSTDYISSIDELPDAADIHRWIEENWEEMRSILLITNKSVYSSIKERTIAECEEAICRAYNLGMINGVDSKGTFNPYGNLTRGQMAQILYNMGWTYAGVLDNYS